MALRQTEASRRFAVEIVLDILDNDTVDLPALLREELANQITHAIGDALVLGDITQDDLLNAEEWS